METPPSRPSARRLRLIREFREMTPGDRGLVLYDGECGLCTGFMKRWSALLEKKRFRPVPLQAPGVAGALGVPVESLLDEMRVVTSGGEVLGGVDGMLHVARHVVRAWPLLALARLPGGRRLLHRFYRWLVSHRYQLGGRCPLPPGPDESG